MSIGGITFKTINGKRYAYYQWTENGKQHSRRVKDDEFAELAAKIATEKAKKNSSRNIQQLVVAENTAPYSAKPQNRHKNWSTAYPFFRTRHEMEKA